MMFTHKRIAELDGADGAETVTPWVYIGPARLINVFYEGTISGTLQLEGSFDGQNKHGASLNAALTKDSNSANILTDKGIPYVRFNLSAVVSGTITKCFLLAHE